MIILIHVLIALSSIVSTAVSFVSPSSKKLKTSYVLIASTLLSGIYLVASAQASLLRTCVSGLLFVTATSIVTHYSRNKLSLLATQTSNNK